MTPLFKKKNKSSDVTIRIDNDILFINENKTVLPIDTNTLIEYFGAPSEVKRNEVFWKDIGISTNPHGNGKAHHITLHTDYNPMELKSKSEQKPFFKGKIIVNGSEIDLNKFDEIRMCKYEVKQFTYTGRKKPSLISIVYNKVYDKDFVNPKLTKDTYSIKKLDEEQLVFSDFGFKLAIIQELMYNKELLKPKFNLNEFIEWYDKRDIDIEKEGYEPIAEVTQYFKDLPIPKRYASDITEIYQDGGSDIYMQLLRFGEGWEDYWDIETVRDAKQFPNLKKATLCYAKENVCDDFIKMGVKAEWL